MLQLKGIKHTHTYYMEHRVAQWVGKTDPFDMEFYKNKVNKWRKLFKNWHPQPLQCSTLMETRKQPIVTTSLHSWYNGLPARLMQWIWQLQPWMSTEPGKHLPRHYNIFNWSSCISVGWQPKMKIKQNMRILTNESKRYLPLTWEN